MYFLPWLLILCLFLTQSWWIPVVYVYYIGCCKTDYTRSMTLSLGWSCPRPRPWSCLVMARDCRQWSVSSGRGCETKTVRAGLGDDKGVRGMPRNARTCGRCREMTTDRAGLGEDEGLMACLGVHVPVAGDMRRQQFLFCFVYLRLHSTQACLCIS